MVKSSGSKLLNDVVYIVGTDIPQAVNDVTQLATLEMMGLERSVQGKRLD